MRSSIRRSGLRSAAAAVTLTVLAAGCGGGGDDTGDSASGGDQGGGGQNEASDTGVTADTITIGGHFPLTGVAAPGYSNIPVGHQCYYEHVNDNGGVYDRQIEWIYRDDAYNPTQATQVVNQLVLEDEVFAVVSGLGTPVHRAVLDFLNSEGVPDLFVSSGSLLWNDPETNPYTFGWQPDYFIEGKIIGDYIAENFPEAKLGLFLQGDDFGENGAAGLKSSAAAGQVVAEATYVPGATDVTPQVQQLQAGGADFVLGFNVPTYTALSQLSARRLNYSPQWFYSNVGSEQDLVGGLLQRFSEGAVSGESPLSGVLTTEYYPTADNVDDPWVQQFQQVWDDCEAKPADAELTSFHLYGMAQAYTTVQALQAAGQNPTRDGIVEAIENTAAEWEGPAYAPFRYSPESHLGISGMKVVRLTAENPEDLTPVLVTDVGDAPIEELAEATGAEPPENGIPDVQPAS